MSVVLGKIIRERRKDLGLTIAKLASAAGSPAPTIGLIEQGRIRPGYDLFCRISYALSEQPGTLLHEAFARGLTKGELTEAINRYLLHSLDDKIKY